MCDSAVNAAAGSWCSLLGAAADGAAWFPVRQLGSEVASRGAGVSFACGRNQICDPDWFFFAGCLAVRG